MDQKKLEKPFKILAVCRADIVGQELMTESEALKLTDNQMQDIAEGMAEGLGGDNFNDCLSYAIGSIKKNN